MNTVSGSTEDGHRNGAMKQKAQNPKLRQLKHYIDSLCGMYTRIAGRLGVDRTYVSRVAKGERRSLKIETALIQDFDRAVEKKSIE